MMQRIKLWFKRFLLWVGATTLLLGVSACGRANDETYHMPTDVERLFTTAEQLEATTTAGLEETPTAERFIWRYTSEDGFLTIDADAPITEPETPLFMTHVSGQGFTQSQITGLFNHLFNGKPVYTIVGENVQTKAIVQSQLEKMNRVLESGTYSDYGFTKEEYEEAISQQEATLQTAPAASAGERITTDGTLLSVRNAESGNYLALNARSDANDSLDIRSAPSSDRSRLASTCRYDRYGAPEYSMLDAVAVQPGETLPKPAQGKLLASFEEAKAESDSLIATAGIDVSLLAAYVVNDRQAGYADGVAQDAAHYAYEFFYTRSIAGVSIAADTWADDGGTNGFPWQYEQISVVVDDAGIAQFRWSEPITLQDETTNCACILTFPRAQEIFEKMAPLVYGSQTSSANTKLDRVEIGIDISHVQLCLLRVKDQTAESKTGLIIPAWVFYGDIVSQTFWKDGSSYNPLYREGMNGANGSDFLPGPTIVFAINAVDGSVIDTSQGY